MAGKGLFAVVGGPPPEEEDDDLEDYSSDLEEDAPSMDLDVGAGPFEAYCETVLDDKAPYEERCEALRQAILTVVEERGGGRGGGGL